MTINYGKFQRPSRYIGGEINRTVKEAVDLRVALAFPDLYEVGMSHLGLKILYEIINHLPYAFAERVFMPAPDVAGYLRSNRLPLSSLESNRPIKDFDLLGFSLQYELSSTTVLEILHLSGIPLLTEQRLDTKGRYPIVLAGGPCATNPLPLSPFIDAFFIGEAEEAIVELLEALRTYKQEGIRDPFEVLKAIASIEGFYVPQIHKGEIIRRRWIEDLESAYAPVRPIVPYMSIVHDRVAIEVTRGCPRGCRFCQAGVLYRPFRQRSVKRILEIADKSLKNTGYETLSLSSLSAGDYHCLLQAMRDFNRLFGHRMVSLSLPSLRVGSVTKEILKELKSIRKSGFTIAPEAATDRLRRVINKDFTNEDYERLLAELFEEGWLNLKLYFMIGLPTERQEDLEAIPKMAHRAIRIAKSKIKRFVNVSVTVSPFIPKAHTPFQWVGQRPIEEIEETLQFLRKRLTDKGIKYKGHDPRMSLLEAVIARGDRAVSELIHKAWQLGACLDGWSEYLNFDLWLKAQSLSGIDLKAYAERTFPLEEPLPWDFVDLGIDKGFLVRQYQAALNEQITPPCDARCSGCGLSCRENQEQGGCSQGLTVTADKKGEQRQRAKLRVRVCFSKTGRLRYLSHLETTHAILRALRRIEVPLDYSKGFNPSPLVSFGPPLSVGVAGLREYFDMEVFPPFDIQLAKSRLKETLPEGLDIGEIALIPMDAPSLTSLISRYDYIVRSLDGRPLPLMANEPKDCIRELKELADGSVLVSLMDHKEQKAKLSEAVRELFGLEVSDLDITRIALYGYNKGWVQPL